ncbi:MAG: DUF309 domain-containing protein [Anaerolineales bacterium]
MSDLFFTAPIETAARALGYEVKWIERGAEIEPPDLPHLRGPAEPVAGRGAAFIARVVEWQPALVLVDLSSQAIPWADWIASLKSSPATRRIPVVAFGPHVDVALQSQARKAGCDVVLAKNALLRDLPALIEKHARRVDETALRRACDQPLSARAVEGIALFNRREFFDAHEVLEHAWNDESSPARELYRGLLQVAVAYLQIERRNYAGALKMFLRVRQWLDPLPEVCRGVNVVQLRADALTARTALEALGPARVAEFDSAHFKPVPMAGSG